MTKPAIRFLPRRDGFTLIELLIVIVILAILATILVPVINKVIQSADVAKSKAFVQDVASACAAFKGENNGKYPGQDDPGMLKGSVGGPYTGSQILAARLFGYPDAEINNAAPKASTKYLEYKLSRLINRSSKGQSIPRNSMGDDSSTANALLYFPSRIRGSESEPTDCYKWADNSEYVSQTGAQAVFNSDDCIRDGRTGGARNPGGILIIGTGPNDMYFESGAGIENDDIRSWDLN